MSVYKNLKPHVHVMKLMGGTGDGKTEIATVFATTEARRILLRGVGRTNSTLKERLLVYSEEYVDKLIIAVKLDDVVLERVLFTDMIANAWAKVVKSQGKVVASIVGKDEGELEQYLAGEINGKNNTRAVLSFLTEEQKALFIRDVVTLYHDSKLGEHNYEIYNTVKNNMADTEVRENSAKFLSALKSEVERVLDLMGKDFRESLWQVWNYVNSQLQSVFFKYFDKNSFTADGYYYKDIYLNNPDENFIEAMFTSNDIQGGERLSLEVLCSEIVIYLPVNKKITDIIQKDSIAKEVFKDNIGNIVFGVLDTRGLYHANNTEDENSDYLSDLLYQGEADAIIMVVPLFGDSNEKKINELYKAAFTNFNKQIPVFMIHNKLDLYVDSLNKDSFEDDPLSIDMSGGEELSAEEIVELIHKRENELREELQKVQSKARKNMEIRSLSCYLKRDKSMKMELVKQFNIVNSLEAIFGNTADYLKETSLKIPFRVIKTDEMEVAIEIDHEQFSRLVHDYILKDYTDKKVFSPGMSDLASSIGKTPHGNAYNALRRRLRNGDGYTSNIDESYFYNCQSFSVNFTANLRNFPTQELLQSLIGRTLHVRGGRFDSQKDGEAFYDVVRKNINPKTLVSILLYQKAIKDAEKTAFSFKLKFQNFLQNSMAYFNLTQLDKKKYTEAMEIIITDAAERALKLNVTFR